MSYDQIMHKLSSAELTLSPQMQDVMQRVRLAGLHKTASVLYGVPEINIKTAVQHLGTSLIRRELKYQKIASGLESLAFVNGEKIAAGFGSNLLRKIVSPLGRGTQSTAPAALSSGLSSGLAGKLESVGKAAPWTGGLASPAALQKQQFAEQVAGLKLPPMSGGQAAAQPRSGFKDPYRAAQERAQRIQRLEAEFYRKRGQRPPVRTAPAPRTQPVRQLDLPTIEYGPAPTMRSPSR